MVLKKQHISNGCKMEIFEGALFHWGTRRKTAAVAKASDAAESRGLVRLQARGQDVAQPHLAELRTPEQPRSGRLERVCWMLETVLESRISR